MSNVETLRTAPHHDTEYAKFFPGADFDLLPKHMHGAVIRYVENGIDPGSFLYCALANDLKGAFGRADRENLEHMKGWVQFIAWHMPAASQGDPELVLDWIKTGGLVGLRKQDKEAIK
jgi:hypothetical protein